MILCKKYNFLGLLISLLSISHIANSQELSPYIVVDQFGYRPNSEKIAVIRNPEIGFDANESFTPGATYALVQAENDSIILTGEPISWQNGFIDTISGDQAWWFNFTEISTEGSYYVLDVEKNVRSFEFDIKEDVYNEILKQAIRTFFYQRVGYAKEPQFASEAWADGASHVGPLQDKNCRKWDRPNDPSTEKDVSGGWYDAGDFNKYTSWTSGYVISLLSTYSENPDVFTDDYNIPESGNGIPDIIDEAKWGVDHLLRLQFENGSVISVIGEHAASPPSSATGQSLWGDPSTSSTLSAASAYAYASKIFAIQGFNTYADSLRIAAEKAWDWAVANPNVLFYNNSENNGTQGLAAGQQETDDYGRFCLKMKAACYLFELTNDIEYKTFFEANYTDIHMMQWYFVFPFESENQSTLLHYASLPNASTAVSDNIKNVYNTGINRNYNFPYHDDEAEPYMSYMKDYTWGSNTNKCGVGNIFYDAILHDINASRNADAERYAERYLHYIHGVNPLQMCYLSNMYAYGAENCVNEFYHSWFSDGSTLWDRVGSSTYGPAPGFLTGGANPSYNWDGCCPSGCGSAGNNEKCFDVDITSGINQPPTKSYLDINNGWPVNSWSITENSCGYQSAYIKLLSKFASPPIKQPAQNITLHAGWNLISLNIEPDSTSAKALFQNANILQVKNNTSFFDKNYPYELNSLYKIEPSEGYAVYSMGETNLEINGSLLEPVVPDTLKQGWNLIGYPMQQSMPIATAIGEIATQIVSIKNFDDYFIPSTQMGNLQNFEHGKAYFIEVINNCVLEWK